VLLTKYYWGNQIKNNEMGEACGTGRGRGEVQTGFWCGNERERGHLEDSSVDGEVILKWMFKK
jgi:hypothetical protein